MMRVAALMALLVTWSLPGAAAQPAGLTEGDRIRVWTAAHSGLTGRVAAVSADRIELSPDGGGPSVAILLSAIQKADISRGRVSRKRQAWKFARWGALLGAGLGAISLGLQHEHVGEHGSSAAKAAALGAYSGALFGGVFGGIVGAIRSGEQWDRLYP